MRVRRTASVPRSAIVAGVVGTAAIHGTFAALVALALLVRPTVRPPLVYSVELVAAPQTRSVRPPSPAPAPVPPPLVTKPAPRAPAIKPPPPPKVDPKTEPAAKPVETPPPNPGATPSTGTDVENVRVEGVAFPYPEYLRRIMNEILRRWARPQGTGNLSAEVSFTIMRDGSVTNIRLIKPSRVYTFDLEAQGAVEQAAQDRAFGPLPAGWPSDILTVAFLFTPRQR